MGITRRTLLRKIRHNKIRAFGGRNLTGTRRNFARITQDYRHNEVLQLNNVESEIFDSVPIIEGSDSTLPSFEQHFMQVALSRGLGRETVNELMNVCRVHKKGDFPADVRSLIGSIRRVSNIRAIGVGSYYNFGLESGLKKVIPSLCAKPGSTVNLQFNVDGLPIYKSAQKGFWPILCRCGIDSTWSKVFIVGLFWGKGKPSSVHDFLDEFVNELYDLIVSGIDILGFHVDVVCHSFICDAPARSYVKCIKSFNAEKGCERCDVQGLGAPGPVAEKEYIGLRFFDTNCNLRTNQSFRTQVDSDHHHDFLLSPLCRLNIDLVRDIPIDYMHLVLLGVVKKCLMHWSGNVKNKGRKFHVHRIGGPSLKIVNEKLELCSVQMTVEFQRRPRSLVDLNFFKATEFRNIVCYLFPFVFHEAFPCSNVYRHYCLLFVAMRLLLRPNCSPDDMQYCRTLLKNFVESCPGVYGNGFMVYNVHNLIHLPDDYSRFGCLDNISAFPFESYMQTLKSYVKRPGRELEQVVKRVHELDTFSRPIADSPSVAILKQCHSLGPILDFVPSEVKQFRECALYGKLLKVNSKDDTVHCSYGYCRAVNILRRDDHVFVIVRPFVNTVDVFDYPCPSSAVGVVFCDSLSNSLKSVHIRDVTKCLRVDFKDRSFIAKLLHQCV